MREVKLSKLLVAILLLVGISAAATYYFSFKATVTVIEANLTVSPQTHTVSVSKGMIHVKTFKVTNKGSAISIYFEDTIEGPSPDEIDVSYRDVYGNSITSSNKLYIPGGSIVDVNMHIDVDEDAATGKYIIIVEARS
jgi:hypothetical protein